MVRFTERSGEFELVYEADTPDELAELKRRINPDALYAHGPNGNISVGELVDMLSKREGVTTNVFPECAFSTDGSTVRTFQTGKTITVLSVRGE